MAIGVTCPFSDFLYSKFKVGVASPTRSLTDLPWRNVNAALLT